jgi:DNA polymerase-3 subunit gamma/tau
MAYLSLYRKYRSQTFDELMGQQHVTQTLQNALRAGRVAHAYLFCGPRGTGKTSTARLLAKSLNCSRLAGIGQHPIPDGVDVNPCNVCDACVRITEGRSLDVIEIDAASNRGIDDIKGLREQVRYSPSQERCKCYIVDEVHQLSSDAFNALLKTLEEPPEHVYFVLATTEAHRVPRTIVSRCQRFDFRSATVQDLAANLRHVAAREGIRISDEALWGLARAASGSWRDSLSLLEQVAAYCTDEITAEDVDAILGAVELPALFSLAEAVALRSPGEVFARINDLVAQGKEPRRLLTALASHFRDLLLVVTAPAHAAARFGPELAQRYKEQASTMSPKLILQAADLLQQTEAQLRWISDHRLLLEMALVKLAAGEPSAAQQPQPQPAPVAAAVQEPPPTTPARAPTTRSSVSAPRHDKAGSERQSRATDTGGNLTLEAIKSKWPQMMARTTNGSLKGLGPRLSPMELTGRRLKVRATSRVFARVLAVDDTRKALEAALKETFGAEITVVPVADGDVGADVTSRRQSAFAAPEEPLVPPPEEMPDLPDPFSSVDSVANGRGEPDAQASSRSTPSASASSDESADLMRLADLFNGTVMYGHEGE